MRSVSIVANDMVNTAKMHKISIVAVASHAPGQPNNNNGIQYCYGDFMRSLETCALASQVR